MRVALGSDTPLELVEAVDGWLQASGRTVVRLDRGDEPPTWPDVAARVARAVASGTVDCGIVCCWTGTGVSIAANKVAGARAALCADAATAAGARTWNDANVLCLSVRATSIPIAQEILEAWFSSAPTSDPAYAALIDAVRGVDGPARAEGPRTRAAP